MTTTLARGTAPRAPDPTGLTAVATPVAPAIAGGPFALDGPVAAAADHGVLVAGRERLIAGTGVAAVLELDRGLDDTEALRGVTAWLAAVRVVAEGAAGAGAPALAAVGAFCFDRSAPTRLVVPRTAWYRSRDGTAWRIEVHGSAGPAGAPPATPPDEAAAPPAPATGSRRRRLREVPPGAAYERAVESALDEIAAGALRKVVLARAVDLVLASVPAPAKLLETLWSGDPAFAPFSVPTRTGRLVGASPELIVAKHGDLVVSHPFAGTTPLGTTRADQGFAPAGDAERSLLASRKDRAEHRLVVEEVATALARRCRDLDVPRAPSVVHLRTDARLGTLIRGTLRDPSADTDLALLSMLHPTPAVAGVPQEAALKAIATLEASSRGYWAGVAGWTDSLGDGEWVLSIRSASLGDGERVRVHAGAGIVAGSSPSVELAETALKLTPVLEALVPGSAARISPGRTAADR